MNVAIETKLNQAIAAAILKDGYAVIEHALPESLTEQLLKLLKSSPSSSFKLGGIGREDDFQTNTQVRRDRIRWLDDEVSDYESYLAWAESLRLELNRQFFLGLFEYECMFAHYPEGAFYKKHVDAFRIDAIRKVSTVLYLNHDWQPDDGGELVMYREEDDEPFLKIAPTFNKMVVFLSEEFPHEVLPAKRSRYSLTGWFRINA
jgi:SM-20-related protein